MEFYSLILHNDIMFNSNWFKDLSQPLFSLPEWIFAPVWCLLYLMIFVAFALFYFRPAEDKKYGYIFFGVQMFLNLIWSPVFFALKNISLAFILIIFLDVFVILTMKKFYEVSKPAGLLLLPYLIWILYATYLNLGYMLLN